MNKKSISILIISICAVFILCAGIFFVRNNNLKKEKELNVVFNNIPASTQNYLKEFLTQSFEGKINYLEALPDKKNLNKIDLYFTWKNNASDELEAFANDIPVKAVSNLPNSLKKQSKKSLPLLLNPYVLDYYAPAAKALELESPQALEDLEKYLYSVSEKVFSPFFCAGGDDATLIALVGAFVQAQEGVTGYERYAEAVTTGTAFDDLEGKGGTTGTAFDVLDMFKSWAKKGLIHPMWYLAKESDVEFFMEQKQIGVLFESLSDHRKAKFSLIKDFDMQKFPESKEVGNGVETGIVGSEIVCMNFGKPAKSKSLLVLLTKDLVQGNLSSVSMLGPTALRGESYDVQADDARFYVAACAGGLLVTEPEAHTAQQFRNYLKK